MVTVQLKTGRVVQMELDRYLAMSDEAFSNLEGSKNAKFYSEDGREMNDPDETPALSDLELKLINHLRED